MAAERWPARKLIRMKCDYVSVASCQTSVKEKIQRFQRFAYVVKFCLSFLSSSFVIRVNFLHPLPMVNYYLWCISTLGICYFQVFFNLKVILNVEKTPLLSIFKMLSDPIRRSIYTR